ncbi:LysR family transcriptional regulator [Lachnospiraceae bacterium LCP25S3_G4]
MNLNQLNYFVTLAHMEHYTKAAKVLSITQPSLSHAISSLEQELGTYLFEKQGRNVVLTKYGKIFLEYVEESLGILEHGIKKTKSMVSDISGRIDIGYIFTQGSEFMPELVSGFLQVNPEKKIEFNFNNGITEAVIEGLKDEKYDVGFCSMRSEEKNIQFIPVAEEELVAVVPKDHELAQRHTVNVEELIKYPQVIFNKGSGLRLEIDELFESINANPEILYTVDEDGALAGLVSKGFGVGIVPNVAAVRSVNVQIIPINNLEYKRYIYMATVKNKYQSPIVKQFMKFVQDKYEIKKER